MGYECFCGSGCILALSDCNELYTVPASEHSVLCGCVYVCETRICHLRGLVGPWARGHQVSKLLLNGAAFCATIPAFGGCCRGVSLKERLPRRTPH